MVSKTLRSSIGFEVGICPTCPDGALLKNATVLKWGGQSDKELDTMFIAEQIYSVLKGLNEKNMPYNM